MHSIALLFLFLKTVNGFHTIPNHVYTDAISQAIHGVDWLSCLKACSGRESCVSYNYKQSLLREDKTSICQLFDRSDYGTCGSKKMTRFLVYASGFIFHQIRTDNKALPCKTQPCHNNRTRRVFADCYEILLAGQTKSGIYTIAPDRQQEFDVYCDQSTEGGGWTVFQKRFDGSVDFYQNWESYKIGFGNLAGEFWLGFDKIYLLTLGNRNTLRVDLGDFNNTSSYAEYGLFKLMDEDDSYELQVGNYTGTSGDSLTWHYGLPFSTKDRDSGDCHKNSCAFLYHGAWWYGDSYRSNLNGRYYSHDTLALDGIIWQTWPKDLGISLKKTEIKVRPYIGEPESDRKATTFTSLYP